MLNLFLCVTILTFTTSLLLTLNTNCINKYINIVYYTIDPLLISLICIIFSSHVKQALKLWVIYRITIRNGKINVTV